MRRTAQMRWTEEAEARRVWLYDAESKPAAESLAGPEILLTRKSTVTVLVARMTGRLARGARARLRRRKRRAGGGLRRGLDPGRGTVSRALSGGGHLLGGDGCRGRI